MSQNEDWRDQAIAEEIRDLLAHDDRMHDVHVQIVVRGGVAHVDGRAPTSADRELVRRLIGRVRGVNAVWDLVAVPGEPVPRIIDIGAGSSKQRAGAIGVDGTRLPAVDLLADLERGLPLRTASIDQVFAVHVLEHIHALIPLMNEIHRVLKPSGVLHVMAPNWQFVNAVADPTHVRFFSAQTFKAFCRPGFTRLFTPAAVATCTDNIFADLRPVSPDEAPPTPEVLARFFD